MTEPDSLGVSAIARRVGFAICNARRAGPVLSLVSPPLGGCQVEC